MDPEQMADQRSVVRNALASFGVMEVYLRKFTNNDLDALHSNGFTEDVDFVIASRAGLQSFLPVARVDAIMAAQAARGSARSTTTSGYDMRKKQVHEHGTSEQRQPLLR